MDGWTDRQTDLLIGELGVKENRKNGCDLQVFPQTGCRIQNDDREHSEDIGE
jgi:hypothetical protein